MRVQYSPVRLDGDGGEREGGHQFFRVAEGTEENERAAINSFVSRKVDGIIAVPVSKSPSFIEGVSASIPVVLIDRYYENTFLPYVCTDNYAGARRATEYLLSKGYRNIMAIQGVRSSMPNKERVKGFLDAVRLGGTPDAEGFVTGDSFSVENGAREIEAVLSAGMKIDAVFKIPQGAWPPDSGRYGRRFI